MHYRKADKAERRNIIHLITSYLSSRDDIIFAYLFGSFYAYDEAVGFRDIDIAVYMKETDDAFSEALSIGAELGSKYNLPLDCLPINDAPLHLKYRIFKDGMELFRKDEDLTDNLIEITVNQALDFIPIREEAIRELL